MHTATDATIKIKVFFCVKPEMVLCSIRSTSRGICIMLGKIESVDFIYYKLLDCESNQYFLNIKCISVELKKKVSALMFSHLLGGIICQIMHLFLADN